MASWKAEKHKTVLMNKTANVFADINPKTERKSQKQKKRQVDKIREEGERTQALAMKIANHIDSMGTEKSKPPDG